MNSTQKLRFVDIKVTLHCSMNTSTDFIIIPANEQHTGYSEQICNEMFESAKARGTGIARREPQYIAQKMAEGKAVIALHKDGRWAGFCYIETWSHGNYVANSGLIVNPEFRKSGLAKSIKSCIFRLSREQYPNAKIFGLTTGLAVMKINSELGYGPVPYSELTRDEDFWKGCRSCINYPILQSKEQRNCLCTAMLWDPEEKEAKSEAPQQDKAFNRYKKTSWMKRCFMMFRKSKIATLFV